MKQKKILYINSIITIVAVLLSSLLSAYFVKSSIYDTRKYELNKLALARVLESTSKYFAYSTVNWKEVDASFRAYKCDMGDKEKKLVANANNKMGIEEPTQYIFAPFCRYYDRLQNAKEDFHRKTIEARIIGTDKILLSLKNVENGFDDVFVEITKDYNLRAFPSSYDMIMPSKFQELEDTFRSELHMMHQ